MTTRQRSGASSKDDELDEEIRQYEKMLPLDKYALDDALEQQPDLFYRISKAFEIASSEADACKSDIDRVYAELDANYREDMAKAGEKVTETAVKQAIAKDPEMRRAIEIHARRRQVKGRWQALKDAYSQRINALRELTSLYAAGYFADSVGNKARRVGSDMREQANRDARSRALAERGGLRSSRSGETEQ